MKPQKNVTDEQLREMRNAVYPVTSAATIQTLESWEHVKPNWMRDVEWLTQEYEKVKSKEV